MILTELAEASTGDDGPKGRVSDPPLPPEQVTEKIAQMA